MRVSCRAAVVGALLWSFSLPAAAGQPEASLIGQTISRGSRANVAGWSLFSEGLFPGRKTQGGVTTETQTCCFAVLARGQAFAIARTEALETTERGGVKTARIVAVKTIARRPSEDAVDCGPLWVVPAFSLKDRRSKIVRSVVMTSTDFMILSWNDLENKCDADG